jgi:flagellar motor switch protein FliG
MSEVRNAAQLNGVQKAAILLTVLGEEAAAALVRTLPGDALRRVTREISVLGVVPAHISQQVLKEYHQMVQERDSLAEGGSAAANRLLVKAFGENGAKNLEHQMVRVDELSGSCAESLQKAEPKQLARLLEGEHPQTVALVLGQMEPKRAATLLVHLPRATRAESVRRLANLRQFSPAIAERISTAVHRRLRSAGEVNKRNYAGFQNVAALMNSVDSDVSREVLENIESQDPKLAANIRGLMFTFEDFARLEDPQLRDICSAVDRKVLSIALKGAQPELRERFFKVMSVRAVDMLKEDMEALGPVRGKDVTKAHGEMVSLARRLEDEGKITLRNDEGDAFI